jgi:DNA-binding NarL/FixJ family response regulator
LFKSAKVVELIDAIRRVAQGQTYLPPNVSTRLYEKKWQSVKLAEITPRRRKCGAYLPLGCSNHQIALALNREGLLTVTAEKVRDELSELYKQLNVPNRQVASVIIDHLQQIGEWEPPRYPEACADG